MSRTNAAITDFRISSSTAQSESAVHNSNPNSNSNSNANSNTNSPATRPRNLTSDSHGPSGRGSVSGVGNSDPESVRVRGERELNGILAWCNTFLSKHQFNAQSLADFSDGVLLMNLLFSVFSSSPSIASFERKYHNPPKLAIHKLENVALAIEFMKSEGVFILSIDSHDVVEKKPKQITNILWNILRTHILHSLERQGALRKVHAQGEDGEQGEQHQVNSHQKGENEQKSAVREKLLQWVKETVKSASDALPEPLDITDFWSSFKDGRGFLCVVQALAPDSADDIQLQGAWKDNARDNLEKAFSIAEQQFGIGRIVDVNDLQHSKFADEKSVINYISLLFSAAEQIRKRKMEMEEEQRQQKERKEKEQEQKKQALQLELAQQRENERVRLEEEKNKEKQLAEEYLSRKNFEEEQKRRAVEQAQLEADVAARNAKANTGLADSKSEVEAHKQQHLQQQQQQQQQHHSKSSVDKDGQHSAAFAESQRKSAEEKYTRAEEAAAQKQRSTNAVNSENERKKLNASMASRSSAPTRPGPLSSSASRADVVERKTPVQIDGTPCVCGERFVQMPSVVFHTCPSNMKTETTSLINMALPWRR